MISFFEIYDDFFAFSEAIQVPFFTEILLDHNIIFVLFLEDSSFPADKAVFLIKGLPYQSLFLVVSIFALDEIFFDF